MPLTSDALRDAQHQEAMVRAAHWFTPALMQLPFCMRWHLFRGLVAFYQVRRVYWHSLTWHGFGTECEECQAYGWRWRR